MEEVLRPGRYIPGHASFSLVNELESVAARIAGADPEHAVAQLDDIESAPVEKRVRIAPPERDISRR
jgi:hypothetical protein